MTDELVFYTHPMSRGRMVRWILEEVGQPYRTEILDYETNMKAPAYLELLNLGFPARDLAVVVRNEGNDLVALDKNRATLTLYTFDRGTG